MDLGLSLVSWKGGASEQGEPMPATPVISGVPVIAGIPQVGQLLTATPGGVSGNPLPVTTWQWKRGVSDISGATGTAYALVPADEGHAVMVAQTESNSAGADTAESSATGTIISAPTGDETVTINIVSRSATQVNPEAFTFDAILTGFDSTAPAGSEIYDDRWHNIYYYWSFGDAYTFAAPTNVVAGHKDANVAYGPMASHTFRTPGAYTVSLTVIEPLSGKTATTTLDVIVGDADTLFAGAATLFVDTGGNYAGKPSGAAEYTSLATAVAAVVAAGVSNPRRIMLRRGQSFPVTGQIWPVAPPSFQIVAQGGAGADPVIDWTPNGGNSLFYFQNIDNRDDSDPAKSVVFQNIEMRGDADVTAGTGTKGAYFFNFGPYPPRDFLLDQCALSNVALAIYDRGSLGGANVQGGECYKVINDCVFTDWIASAIFESSNKVTALTGSRLAQNPDAIVDFDGADGSIIAPYRGAYNDRVIVDACDLFCNTGWSGTPSGTYKAIQPGLRFNSAANPGAKLSMQRCSVEAGFEVVSLADANGENAVAINAVIEKNILLSNFQGWWFFDTSYGGVTIRNNILAHPDVGDASGRDPVYVMRLDYTGANAIAYNAPIKIHNNTLVNLLTGSSYVNTETAMRWVSNPSAFANVVIENNIDHQPNLTNPVVASAPLDVSTILFTPRYDGYVSAAISAKDTSLATPANTVATYAPLAGSSALGNALNEPAAYDDFYGQQRPQYPSSGAFEQSS